MESIAAFLLSKSCNLLIFWTSLGRYILKMFWTMVGHGLGFKISGLDLDRKISSGSVSIATAS